MANIEETSVTAPVNAVKAPVKRKKNNKIRDTFGDTVLEIITTVLLILITILVAYPVIFVVSASFSSNAALMAGRVVLLPVEFTFEGYKTVFGMSDILLGYRNTIFYTVFGVMIKMFMQITCAYPLSKVNFQGRKAYTKIIVLTMLVNAGLIPVYLVKQKLGLVDSVWAILISGALGASNVFILRTAFKSSIPRDLFDAAAIDGANEFQCLVKIAIPLAKATISVVTLYAIVGCWNEYFTAMIYLPTKTELHPLQLFLRNLLVVATTLTADSNNSAAGEGGGGNTNGTEGMAMIRYALIVCATVPVLVAYACVQRYFKSGVMIGSVKG